MNDVVFLEIFFIISVLFIGHILRLTNNQAKVLYYSFVFHTLASLLFWQYSRLAGSDAKMYYETAKSFVGHISSLYQTGTGFIRFVCYPFVHNFEISFFALYMLFNFFGFVGFCYFYLSVLEQLEQSNNLDSAKYLNAFMFLPGLNFWTASIGKDSVIFLGIGMLLYALANLQKRFLFLLFSLLVIYHVRPHIFFLVIVSLVIAFMLREGVFRLNNLAVFFLALVVAFLSKDVILQKAGVSALDDISSGTEYLDKRAGYNQGGGSSLDISQYNFFLKIFAYLYRPLFFDANSATMLAASMENAVYLFLTIQLVTKLPFLSVIRERKLYIMFGIVFFLLMLIIMSWSTSNLGIAVRQKTMFIPILLAFYCISLSRQRK